MHHMLEISRGYCLCSLSVLICGCIHSQGSPPSNKGTLLGSMLREADKQDRVGEALVSLEAVKDEVRAKVTGCANHKSTVSSSSLVTFKSVWRN